MYYITLLLLLLLLLLLICLIVLLPRSPEARPGRQEPEAGDAAPTILY